MEWIVTICLGVWIAASCLVCYIHVKKEFKGTEK